MAEAARMAPQRIKVSSKRQITIPAKAYKDMGFTEYALIEQTDEGGTPLAEVEQEPLRVEVDGVEYWRVAPAPEVFWSLTEAGAAKLDSYRPMEMIAALYETEPQYGAIFTTCLELCARDGGASLREIGDVVDDEPVLQNPKRYAMYFIDKLEHAGAVEWTAQWSATEHGRAYLHADNEN